MANMFNVQLPMILSLPRSITTANYGPSSKGALKPLMVAIFTFLHPLPSKVSIGTEKAFFHRIACSYAISIWSSHTFSQDGKVLQQMLVFGLMHWQIGFSVPAGFYYLADAGYPHCQELVVPFRGVRYHLQEWGAVGVRYVSCMIYLLFIQIIRQSSKCKGIVQSSSCSGTQCH